MNIKSFRQKDRYGNETAVEFFDVPEMQIPQYDHPGDPKGPDTVPAWLTPGEFVVNAEAVRMFEPQIEAMNNVGREIQAAQGGTIPEGGTIPNEPVYASEGGFLSNFFESLKKPEAGEVNTAAMSEAQRNIFEQSENITPELLDAVKQVESNGDLDAKSKAGALGAYQIIPSENMGYGIGAYQTPGQNENKDRAIAQAYLSGIAAENPEYTMAEILQAYNAGPGRIAKFKAGQGDPLADETVQYPEKVAAAMDVPIEALGVPPKGEGNWYDFLFKTRDDRLAEDAIRMAELKKTDPKRYAEIMRTRASRQAHKIAKTAPPIRGGLSEDAQADLLAKKVAFQNEYQSAQDKTQKFDNMVEVENINEDIDKQQNILERQQGTIETVLDAGGVPTEGLLSAVDRTKEKISNLENEKSDLQNKISTAEAESKTRDQDLINRGKEAIGQDVDDQITSATTIADEAEQDSQTGSPQMSFEESLRAAGYALNADGSITRIKETSAEDDSLMSKAADGFMRIFGGLFDEAELGRMAVVYAGSRLLGYDHSGSVSYAMKNYITNIDTKLKARREFITDKDSLDEFTTKSLQEYYRTGDISVLERRGTKGIAMESVSGSVNLIGEGRVNTYKDENGVEYVKLDYAKELGYPSGFVPVAVLADYIEPWDSSTQSDKAIESMFQTAITNEIDSVNETIDEDSLKVKGLSGDLARQATSEYLRFIRRNGVSINGSIETRGQINRAIRRFVEDNAQAKRTGKDIPKSLRAYINEEVMIPLTGIESTYLNSVDPEVLTKIDNKIRSTLDVKNPRDPKFQAEYQENWKYALAAFQLLPIEPDKDELKALQKELGFKVVARSDWADRAKGKKQTAFSIWLSNTSVDQINKMLDYIEANQ